MKAVLIATCGMNCSLCYAYIREKNVCPGCRAADETKPVSCARCIIKNCEIIKANNWKYCSAKCENYPCLRLKNLDKRYRIKYHMSMIENLGYIEAKGIRKFIENEKRRWMKDGQIFCVHRDTYFPVKKM